MTDTLIGKLDAAFDAVGADVGRLQGMSEASVIAMRELADELRNFKQVAPAMVQVTAPVAVFSPPIPAQIFSQPVRLAPTVKVSQLIPQLRPQRIVAPVYRPQQMKAAPSRSKSRVVI
jgi:hypothetical protein